MSDCDNCAEIRKVLDDALSRLAVLEVKHQMVYDMCQGAISSIVDLSDDIEHIESFLVSSDSEDEK